MLGRLEAWFERYVDAEQPQDLIEAPAPMAEQEQPAPQGQNVTHPYNTRHRR